MRRSLLASLLGLSLLAGAPCASASLVLHSDRREACCCSRSARESGCDMHCADGTALEAVCAVPRQRLNVFPPVPAGDAQPAGGLAVADVAPSHAVVPQTLLHAPPLKRYLLACALRL